jgi:hypothetical protein
VTYRWKDLARKFEMLIGEKAGIPQSLFVEFPLMTGPPQPDLGSLAMKRVFVEWRHWPKREGIIPIDDSQLALSAEFDLESGETKSIHFEHPSLIGFLPSYQKASVTLKLHLAYGLPQ